MNQPRLRAKPLHILQDMQRAVYIITYCDHGKHRSVAVACILAHCLMHDLHFVDTTEKDFTCVSLL